MQWLRTPNLINLLNNWVWGLTWIVVSLLSGQQIDDVLVLFGREAEDPLPEEDVVLLEDILQSQGQPTTTLLERISDLSFLSETDIEILKAYSDTISFISLKKHPAISEELKAVLSALGNPKEPLNIGLNLKQIMVVRDDVRYQWWGLMAIQEMKMGLFIERDPGEGKIGDRLSGYLAGVHKRGDWILGDHQVLSGYGLLLWRSISVKKGFESIRELPRSGRGLLPYRSSHESWNLRGIGVTWKSNWGDLLFSLGRNPRDGIIDSTGQIIIKDSGLHISETAVRDKGNLEESILLGQWKQNHDLGQVGITVVTNRWVYGVENIEKQFNYFSAYASHRAGSWTTFGEWAKGISYSQGVLLGAQLKKSDIKYLIAARSYSNGFNGPRANPFAEWTGKDRNEIGLYQGINLRMGKHQITLFGDLYREASMDINSDFPSQGQEAAWRWEWRGKTQSCRIQWKQEIRSNEKNTTYSSEPVTVFGKRQTIKLIRIRYLSKQLTWKLQFNYTKTSTDQAVARGSGFESLWKWQSKELSATVQWITTVVDSYNARLYFWDVNLPGEMRSRMFSTPGHSPGVKIIYRSRDGFRLGVRIRATWRSLQFRGNPDFEGALIIEAVL